MHRPLHSSGEIESYSSSLTHPKSSPLVLSHSAVSHHPKAGVNPLVDAAAYLFSLLGKIKQLKSYQHLNKLRKELINEIKLFQETAKSHYSSEYVLVSRYALCGTLDDVIINTSWGYQGQWDNQRLLAVFNPENTQPDRFFLILERIIKDPSVYIDLMEFVYICLSLGFKGGYRSTERHYPQLEQVTHSLYKHIRAYRGEVSKTLSPFPLKVIHPSSPPLQKASFWLTALITTCIIMVLFTSLGYMLDTMSNQAYRELMHIGKSILYETHDGQ